MPRYIPIELKEDLKGSETTTCLLMRVDPVTPGFASYGVTTLNRDFPYDDGTGVLNYSAAVGFQPTSIMQTANLQVDNATAESLLPEFDIPVSEDDIRAGAYDFAKFTVYIVNYDAPEHGHITLHKGTLGRVTVDNYGLSMVNELRGLSAKLKQSLCRKDSLTCRAIFGSQWEGSSTPGPEVNIDPCGFDATTLLVAGTVIDVGTENTRTFQVDGFTHAINALQPGIFKFLSGANAGRTHEIESNTSDGWITLANETPYVIAVDDTGEYREDCTKHARDDAKGCLKHHGINWVRNFRGEPDIPIGDAGAMETPGASSSPGLGGATYQPLEQE